MAKPDDSSGCGGTLAPCISPEIKSPIAALDVPAEQRAAFRRDLLGLLSCDAGELQNLSAPGELRPEEYSAAKASKAAEMVRGLLAIVEKVGWEMPTTEDACVVSAPTHLLSYVLGELGDSYEARIGDADLLDYGKWLTVVCEQFPKGGEAGE